MDINLVNLKIFEEKMCLAGVDSTAQQFFAQSYLSLRDNEQGYIKEEELESITNLPSIENLDNTNVDHSLLDELVVIKLNGGLGTSMGLDKPKSFLPIKGGKSFLDLTLDQIIKQRQNYGKKIQFLLLNSFNSSQMTLDYLQKYKSDELAELELTAKDTELLQNQVPRIDCNTGKPAEHPSNPSLEWNPPGHGDIYTKLYTSGKLEALIKEGKRYAFISNMDNLGAVFDVNILHYMKSNQLAFLMEVCQRSTQDKKGGHLAKYKENGQWVLRERAQCAPQDIPAFEDIQNYQYFNTNNLWVDLNVLYDLLKKHQGVLPLPLIQNTKQLDPVDAQSAKVLQLEVAMGSALACFDTEQVGLLQVSRERFMPVKNINDWWLVRSDVYSLNFESTLTINSECAGAEAPIINLGQGYQHIQDAEQLGFIPSLKHANKFELQHQFIFQEGVIIKGDVTFVNKGDRPAIIKAGIYKDKEYEFHTSLTKV